ncbi:Flagellar hook-associated protein 1, FlgK [Erwinia sp. Ejp617]|nr:flagellar hook-associated protein FlgK [Erwinia sp. Ejp617]ADP09804.1 Flagellar hook-associated protein 1, FlgK [Erwinia sp. Ejp617]
MNLFNIARSGLSSSQAGLSVIGSNINNAMNGHYSRRDILLGESGGMISGKGFYGFGVQVNGVQRGYDAFINNELRGGITACAGHKTRYEQLAEIDNMLGNDETNPSVSLNKFFEALKEMEKDPSAPAARQSAYSTLGSLTYQFNSSSERLTGLEKSTNTQIKQSVDDINSCTQQLAKLNENIEKIVSQHGTPPADLLDARDGLLEDLSMQTGIKVNEDKLTGRMDVTLADGRPLVSGTRVYQLKAEASAENPNKTVVSYIDASGNATRLDEERMTGGALGGLFTFRNEDLSKARNELNQMALKMAGRFNEVNGQGYDQNGNPGGDLFNVPTPEALANRNNGGDASIDARLTAPYTDVKAEDYTITFTNGDWEVKGADGRVVPHTLNAAGELEFDGVSLGVSGTAEEGDSFMLNPAAGVAENVSVAVDNGEAIAASDSSDPEEVSNNKNLAKLLGIQDEKLVGKATLTESYASLVSGLGSSTSALKADYATAGSVLNELTTKWQSVVGVNLEDEYVTLSMFEKYYQANAQVLQTATTMLDTLLAIK